MKKHVGSTGSKGNGKKRKEAKKANRERAYRKAHNVLVNNYPTQRREWAAKNHTWRTWLTRKVRKGAV